MKRFTQFAVFMAAIFAMFALAAPASAQATRTWISGVGDDVNPCSRTAPCKTFAGAISKTAAGGEIDCLDPGGFGAVTVTKSITLDCGGGIGGQAGSILNSGTNGVTVNCASLCSVKVRNLTINGIQLTGSPGLSGIKVLNNVASCIVEDVGIFGQGGTSGNNGGIDFEPNIASKLYTHDVEIQYGLGDGILIKPQVGGSAGASLDNTDSLQNSGSGLRVDSTNVANGAAANVTMVDSVVSGNQIGVFAYTPASTGTILVMLERDTAANNAVAGVDANGATSTIRIGQSTVSGNGTGIAGAVGGSLQTYGNNQVAGNTTDVGTTSPILPK